MKISPCPFCGSNTLEYMNLSCGECDEGDAVFCHTCGANGPVVYKDYTNLPEDKIERAHAITSRSSECEKLAIEKWNNREGVR